MPPVQGEAAAAREEFRGARKDLLQFRNEGNSLRALYDIANAKAMEQSAQSDQRIAALRTQLADAVGQLAEMAPISELQSARQQTEAARVSPATTNTLALSIAAHMRHATEHCRALSA